MGNSLKILGLPPMKGKNLGVISRSGGHAVIAADACELSGFNLAQFPQAFLREIEEYFRASVIRLTNPLDLGDLFDLNVYAEIIERTLQLEGVDGVVFLHTALSEAENLASRSLLERIIGMVERYNKPVAYYISTAAQEVNYLKQHYHFPIFTQVVETIRALEMSRRHYEQSQRARSRKRYRPSRRTGRRCALWSSGRKRKGATCCFPRRCRCWSITGSRPCAALWRSSVEEAQAAAAEMGYPVAIKVIAGGISHKSDAGGVQLNLRNGEAVAAAYADMVERIRGMYPEVELEGVLVQPMVTGGRELILGGRQDAQFGPVVLLGLGGVFVEILEEVVVRIAPLTRSVAAEMVESLRGAAILKGARGHKPADIDALVEALLRLSQLLCDFPEIREVDINPLRLFQAGEGCCALDARMVLEQHGISG